eukprot:50661_1
MDIVNNEEFYSLKEKIQYCSIIQVIVSLIFWIWALLNVLRGTNNFDSGCVLFVLSLVSGMFGFASMNLSPSSPQKKKRRALSFAHLNLGMTICSHILIALSYFGAAIMIRVTGFQIYCVISGILWSIALIPFTIWQVQWRKKLKQQNDDLQTITVN